MKITRQQLKKIILEELENMPQGDEQAQGKPPEAEAEAAPLDELISDAIRPAQLKIAMRKAVVNAESVNQAVQYWINQLSQSGAKSSSLATSLRKILSDLPEDGADE